MGTLKGGTSMGRVAVASGFVTAEESYFQVNLFHGILEALSRSLNGIKMGLTDLKSTFLS